MSVMEMQTDAPEFMETLNERFAEIFGMQPNAFATHQQAQVDALKKLLDQQGDAIKAFLQSAEVQKLGMHAALKAVAGDADKITAQAFWWGFHVVIPEKPLHDILTATDVGKVIAGVLGIGFGVAGVPPVAIMIGVLVVVFGIESLAIKAVDKGKGVYLSWTWPQVPALVLTPAAALPLPTAIL